MKISFSEESLYVEATQEKQKQLSTACSAAWIKLAAVEKVFIVRGLIIHRLRRFTQIKFLNVKMGNVPSSVADKYFFRLDDTLRDKSKLLDLKKMCWFDPLRLELENTI